MGTCFSSSYSDRECLTISVLCSQITDIVSYTRTLRAWYMAAWDTFIGHTIYRKCHLRKFRCLYFFIYLPQSGFPIDVGYNNEKKISVTSWSRSNAITIIIHIYLPNSWCELHDILLTGQALHISTTTTAIPNPNVRPWIKRRIYIK
jgi:hypothetical protein